MRLAVEPYRVLAQATREVRDTRGHAVDRAWQALLEAKIEALKEDFTHAGPESWAGLHRAVAELRGLLLSLDTPAPVVIEDWPLVL